MEVTALNGKEQTLRVAKLGFSYSVIAMQPRNRRIEESFEEGCVHLLEKPVIEDARLKLCDWLRLEKVQVLRCDDARNQVSAISSFNLLGLSEEDGL